MKTLTIKHDEKILVIAPHPDDESIGAGGLLAKYGKQSEVWLLTDGKMGGDGNVDIIEVRKKEFVRVMQHYGVENFRMMNLPDGGLINCLNCLDNISLSQYGKIFVTPMNDRHPDHIAACNMVKRALDVQRNDVTEVYLYEISNPLSDFSHILDITDVIEKKRQGIAYYKSQTKQLDYVNIAISMNSYRASIQGYRDAYVEAYMQLASNIIVDNNSTLLMEKYYKVKSYYHTYDMWIDNLIQGKTIEQKLLKMDIRRVAVYGYGLVGRRLIQCLDNSNVFVLYVLDRAHKESITNIPVYMPQKGLDKVDAVIVTTVYDYADISQALQNEYDYDEVISLNDLF